MYDEALVEVTVEAEAQLRGTFAMRAPGLSRSFDAWLAGVFGGASVAEAFTRPEAFPMLLIPWWIDGGVGQRDRQLHRLLTHSTMSGYLSGKLIDTLTDADGPGDTALLQALEYLHLEFVAPYHRLFQAGHPFWGDLRSILIENAEVAFEDATSEHIDRQAFERVSARNTGVVRIPIAAVCHYRGADRKGWDDFATAMGRWQQFHDDAFGWRRDLADASTTFFLSEGRRHRPDAVEAWVVDEGFAWAMAELERRMRELKRIAAGLDTSEALWYLEERHESVVARAESIERDIGVVLGLSSVVSAEPGSAR